MPSATIVELIGADGQGVVSTSNPLPVGGPSPVAATLSQAVISAASTSNTIVSGTAGQTIKVYRMVLALASPTTLTIGDDTPSSFSGAMTLSTLTLDYSGEPWYVTGTGKALVFTLGSAVQMSGTIWYVKS